MWCNLQIVWVLNSHKKQVVLLVSGCYTYLVQAHSPLLDLVGSGPHKWWMTVMNCSNSCTDCTATTEELRPSVVKNDTASTETVISPTKDISSVCTDLGTTAAKQLLLAQLPATVHGIKRKRFQKACYTGRPWIEYSVQLDACFCYCCRTFTKETDLAAQLLNLACVRCAWLLCDFSVNQRIAN